MASLVAQASSSALALNSRAVASPQSKLALGSASRVACLPRPLVARGVSRGSTLVAPRAVAVEADSKVGRLGSEIKTLTLEEARLLVDYLQEALGVSAAAFAPAAAVAAPAAGAEAAPAVEEKTEFDLVLEEVPSASRIAVIKVIRSITSLGLKEAKDLIDGLPKPIKEAVGKDEAEDAKKQLEGAGAKCSVK